MPFHLVSYATPKYRHRQFLLHASARANGIVASSTSWNPEKLLTAGFGKLAPDISLAERGSGFWSWKPFIILRALEDLADGEILLYCDAGRKYPYILLDAPLDPFTSWMDEKMQDIMPGILIPWNGPMSVWTKHEAYTGTGIHDQAARQMSPIQASFSIWRNKETTREFVREWLSWCIRRELVSDDKSKDTTAESPDFKAHRHDQSLLNLCCYKHGIKGIHIGETQPAYNERDPSHIAIHHFGSGKTEKALGRAIATLTRPIELTEQMLRNRITLGEKFD